jgi:hypothetical protein
MAENDRGLGNRDCKQSPHFEMSARSRSGKRFTLKGWTKNMPQSANI